MARSPAGHDVAVASPLRLSSSRTYPVERDRAFTRTLTWPLEELFCRRYGPIPPIAGTDQEGEWGAVGQERPIRTGDGGSMRERLVEVDPPHRFAYEITGVTGPMKPLASRIEGSWSFDEVGTGCRITWRWTIHPASGVSALALPAFGRFWNAYARRSLDHLEELLLRPTQSSEDVVD